MDIVKKTIKDILSLKIQGATNVRKKSVEALVKASKISKAKTPKDFRKEFLKNAKSLFNARPTEPELRTAIRIIKKSISNEELTIEQMKKCIILTEQKYEKDREDSLKRISEYGAQLIKPGAVILTLCHSSSVVNMLIKAKGKIKKVYACETRPLYQGRITAEQLTKAGIDTTLIIDNAASTILKECDYFFTGADAFLADGDVINKIGTNQISTLCKRYSTMHYVVTSTHKFEPASFFGKDEPIEERSPEEVWEKKGKNVRGKIKIINPAFDRTDSQYIEGIISEIGIFPPEALAAELYKKLQLAKHHEDFLKL
jgi:ribose 1,5-bisphosphate isomerase